MRINQGKFLSQESCFARSLHFWRVSWTSGGGVDLLHFSECPTLAQPSLLGGGAWTLGLSESQTATLCARVVIGLLKKGRFL